MRAVAAIKDLHHRLAVPMLLSLFALSAITLAGCNTSEGFGRDLESVGEDIQEEAD